MYFGFSGSTGVIRSHQYILGWALAIGEKAQSLDISKVLDLPQPAPSSPTLTKGQVITISIISVLVFLMIPSGILYLYFRKKYAEVFEQWEQQYSPQRFSFRTLYKATNGFKGDRVIGAGGFGKVYRGDLSDGTQVAVKKVSHGSQQGLQEYISEISTMTRLGHMNLVQLRGYCRRQGELILVYEHMPNGNLSEYLLKGTTGYMAPELMTIGVATTWTDVYAFGALMLEVICGRKPVDPNRPGEQKILVNWVASCGRRSALMDTIDSELAGDFEEAKLLLKLGMLCSQSDPEKRPSMEDVTEYLEQKKSIPDISFDTAEFGLPIANEINHETA
ncbi:unnamed protein product, partial [Arabidopsis halleri]